MIALIVAYDRNRAIGYKGCIPWKIEGEQKRFRELTTGNVVIMGRRTYEEIGFPLPNRTTIVVSSTKQYNGPSCYTVSSLEEAIQLAGDRDMYISGGQRLYEEALERAEYMYITEVDLQVLGDTYFPNFDTSQYIKSIEKKVEGEVSYAYITYQKKKN